MPPDPVLQISFHSLAFELLGIEGLPLPRTNWHLKDGQDGYDDPHLTEIHKHHTLRISIVESIVDSEVRSSGVIFVGVQDNMRAPGARIPLLQHKAAFVDRFLVFVYR
jgi:hypothetical protein